MIHFHVKALESKATLNQHFSAVPAKKPKNSMNVDRITNKMDSPSFQQHNNYTDTKMVFRLVLISLVLVFQHCFIFSWLSIFRIFIIIQFGWYISIGLPDLFVRKCYFISNVDKICETDFLILWLWPWTICYLVSFHKNCKWM